MTAEFDNPLTRLLVRVYRPFVEFALTRPFVTLLIAALALVSAVPIALRLGGEFLPRVDEGDLLFMPTALAGAPVEELAAQLQLQDRALGESKEVATVFGKVGRAETATDPAPLSMVETTVRLRPREEWPRYPRARWYSRWAPPFLRRVLAVPWPEESPATTSELIGRLDRAARLPGWANAWTAPARGRADMMATGIRTPVGIRIAAADPVRLEVLGSALRTVAGRVPGTRSAVFESLGGETRLEFVADEGALAAHHVEPALAKATADLLLSGGQIGELEKDGRRLRVRVAQDFNARGPADQIREITVRAAGGQPVPLALLGRPAYRSTPAMVRTEGSELAAYLPIDLDDGTDLLGYVENARRAVAAAIAAGELRFGPGERIDWIGQYPLLVAGARRLRWIVPVVALSMLLLLYLQFRNLTEALLILVSVPFALVGSFWTLFWLGYPLSAPVWVGLLSVAGLAMQTGVVMVVYIDEAFYRRLGEGRLRSREDIVAAHADGTVRRLRPKVMTITTMAAGLLPLVWTEGAGAEIVRRIAAPMLGGLLTSAFLTLEVLPVLYTIWRDRQLRRARRLGIPIETFVGSVPAWALGALDRALRKGV
jgi:Cu(I)/Ag(I) efflux system membrane protein CusA/SilA